MSRLLISAAHKSSGKTTLTLGLCAAFTARGTRVQPFKKGPDYIDPMWLGQATGRPCYNLDFYTMARDEILAKVARHDQDCDLVLVEGNKGLYDGLDLDGSNSNAALARLLALPVILVLDARGMTRGIAPLILGYQQFEPDIRIAGVILNQLGGSRHEAKLRRVIEHYTDVPVVGAVARDESMQIVERHLGLVPSNEDDAARRRITQIRDRIACQVDLDRVRAIADAAPPLPRPATAPPPTLEHDQPVVRIGIARDRAFGFYYPDDLEALSRAGAELVPFDTLRHQRLPDIDGLFIGGGFPEAHMQALEANVTLREQIRNAIEAGMPAYAECGGLMYLSRSITWHDYTHEMVGVIPGRVHMHDRPQGRGYVRLGPTADHPWPAAPATTGDASELPGHEFHYSSLDDLPASARFAYRVLRGTGIDGQHDGFLYRNLLACYAHQRDTWLNPWAQRFVDFVRTARAADANA